MHIPSLKQFRDYWLEGCAEFDEQAMKKTTIRRLEHISVWLNRGDSQRFVSERVWRH
jgi:hypothetical protein